MKLRYKDLKFIKNLLDNDYYYNYFYENYFNVLSKTSKSNTFLVKKRYRYILYFRYIFWMLLNQNYSVRLQLYMYKYILNYIFFLSYLNSNSVNYYNLYYFKKLKALKINKRKQKKYIKYLVSKKKIKIIFFFKFNNYKIDFIYNAIPKKRLKIWELNLINSNYLYLLMFVNYINN